MADEQATTDLRSERLGRGAALADWAFANAAKQKFDLENAVLKKTFGGEFSTIPFGNTVVMNQAPIEAPSAVQSVAAPVQGLLSKVLPLAAAAALGATGAGGVLAIPAIASLFSQKQPAATQPGVIEFPVQIDWNFDPHGGTVQPKQ